MCEDPKCFKKFASLQGKRLFTTFSERILENCFGFLIVYLLDFLDIFMICVSKEITYVSMLYDVGVNYNLRMLRNLAA